MLDKFDRFTTHVFPFFFRLSYLFILVSIILENQKINCAIFR